MIKMFISDLDGTLLTDHKTIRTEDSEGLLYLAEKGVDICFASGRIDNDIKWAIQEMNCRSHRISQNGGHIINYEGLVLHSRDFEPEMAHKLCEAAKEFDALGFVSANEQIFLNQKSSYRPEINPGLSSPIIEELDLHLRFGDELRPTKLTYVGELETLKRLQQKLHEEFPEQFDSYISFSDCLDLMPLHVSKGNAVNFLMKELGLTKDEVVCIGDSYNDIPMFNVVTNSFAMEHADDEVKQHATHIVKSVREACEWVSKENGYARISF
ncbi:HAD family hydrolase [Brevibacillus daliensis]|uniref:HAD family hydrolase n=1 Tax=Brevibacillus daliensis TaxID=2892995 RepID=UPI001E578B28|nr:HAD family hydrolase [Brevibacillus daliensis]